MTPRRIRGCFPLGTLAGLVVAGLACSGAATPTATPAPASPVFVDVAADVGLDFTHFNGMSGKLYLCEMMGPGGALFDYDNDGDLDVFIVQGRTLSRDLSGNQSLTDRLFRNDLRVREDGTRELRFTDVTGSAGLQPGGYGMGVAAGDYDNDGWVDLYVTNFGANQLLRNLGNGKFADVTEQSGTSESRWSVSASFADLNGDGLLDLYVGNYLDFTLENHKKCFNLREDYCNPNRYNPLPDRLFINRGDGSFDDRSIDSGIAREYGGALGVVAADLNGDGLQDIYVANDGLPNQLWTNRGDGSFENTALLAGCAFNEMGDAEAGMGCSAGDFDNDGDEDLFLAHLATETNTLYVNDGKGLFIDGTRGANLSTASLALTGFGTGWLDFDNDGDLDVMVVNGAVTIIEELALAGDPFPLSQPNLIFRNNGEGRFEDYSDDAGAVFKLSEVSRGAAFGDVDNDGDTDVLLLNNNGPARLLLNQVGNQAHWIGLQILGPSGRPLLGTRVRVTLPDGQELWRGSRADGSYGSANDPRVLIGLGAFAGPVDVTTFGPDGSVEEWSGLTIDRWTILRPGDRDRSKSP